MKEITLILVLLRNMGVVVTFAYLLSRTELFKRFFNSPLSRKERVFLIFFFGAFSLCGTYLGIYIMDAYANIRAIGAIVAGLLGGPIVGLMAGAIGGAHRYTLGGFTALACTIGTMVSGLVGGLFHNRFRKQEISSREAFLIGLLAIIVEMIIVISFSRPIDRAIRLVGLISFPMIMANAVGISIFINILNNVRDEVEDIKSHQAKIVLEIANRTLNYLRQGLSNHYAVKKAADVIYELTEVSAVAITDRKKIVAFVGEGDDHHKAGEMIQTGATKRAIADRKIALAKNKEEVGCPIESCPLQAVIVAPLKWDNQVMGTLKLYHTEREISKLDTSLAIGISSLLSTQIQIAQLAEEAKLKTEAELKALQAQIHPHFLFNSLNTIASFVRTDPQKARELLLNLSDFFRTTLGQNQNLITLQKEVNCVNNYYAIVKARFGNKVNLIIDIKKELLSVMVPQFTIQPIVENAMHHGILPKEEGGNIEVNVKGEDEDLIIEVTDNGVGIPENKKDKVLEEGYGEGSGFGLSNVAKRIHNIFGSEYGIQIESGDETKVIIKMPMIYSKKRGNDHAASNSSS